MLIGTGRGFGRTCCVGWRTRCLCCRRLLASPPGSTGVLLVVSTPAAVSVSEISAIRREQEVVLRFGTRLRVTSIVHPDPTQVGGYLEVHADDVNFGRGAVVAGEVAEAREAARVAAEAVAAAA